jgi:hypothetical protein
MTGFGSGCVETSGYSYQRIRYLLAFFFSFHGLGSLACADLE